MQASANANDSITQVHGQVICHSYRRYTFEDRRFATDRRHLLQNVHAQNADANLTKIAPEWTS